MRGDIDLREIKLSKLRVSRRSWTIIVAGLVVAAALALGWRYVTHPPRPWLVRWKLDRYLQKESHARDFKVDFPFPSKAEMAKPAEKSDAPALKAGPRTGKTFDALRDEYLSLKTAAVALERGIVRGETELKDANSQLESLTKQIAAAGSTDVSNLESNANSLRAKLADLRNAASRRAELNTKAEAIAPIEDDLWEFQKRFAAEAAGSDATANAALVKARAEFADESERKLRTAASYDAMYKIIGQELFVAKGLLASANPEHRRLGVTTALNAARHSFDYAVNGGVAARIVEGYVLPNLDLATDTNRRSMFNEENLLNQCANIFQRNYEYNNVVRAYEIYLATVKNPARADWARERIGSAYEDAGDIKSALQAYRQIQDTNSYRNLFFRQIPRLEKQLKG
jgi:hypothetical protein